MLNPSFFLVDNVKPICNNNLLIMLDITKE